MDHSESSYDVIVVGCGVGGLCTALAAREAGADVLVLERATREERGGNTRYTEAFLRMKSLDEPSDDFEERFADNAGGHLDPALVDAAAGAREEWPAIVKALSFADPDTVSTFSEKTGETLAWMTRHGVSFDFLPTPFLTMSAPRMAPRGGGLAIVEALTKAAEAAGVKFAFETSFKTFATDEGGTIIGVQTQRQGNARTVFAPSVVLASGGFEGNPEMLARYLGPRALYLRPVARGGYYNRGEGIREALRHGAAPCGDFGSYHAEPVDPRAGIAEPAIFIFPYGILVNREGRRFTDEAPATVDATYEAITRQIFAQSEGLAYVILDARIADVPSYHRAIRTDQPPLRADSIEALARALAVPEEALTETVATYNAACSDGPFQPLEVDGLATRGLDPPKSNWARPLDTPPFIAYPIMSSNVFTFGGLKVDGHARVIDGDGHPMPGLYAAGEVVGLYYKTYTGSTSVLKGAVFGRLAGSDAARFAKERAHA